MVNIIKNLLQENKKTWHKKLIYALWAHRVNTKKSIGISPFQLVYGTYAIFISSLINQVMNLLQEVDAE